MSKNNIAQQYNSMVASIEDAKIYDGRGEYNLYECNKCNICKHGAIFNGTYSNNIWFCMDGYIYDTYKGNPIYSSMSSIPPSWEPIAWMPKPKFEE